MVVADLRFDTRNDPEHISGPTWKMAAPESSILPKFAIRHPRRSDWPKKGRPAKAGRPFVWFFRRESSF
jgi:hypothetical protein